MNDADANRSLFARLHHVALVVENLDDAVARLQALGLGPFLGYPPLREYVSLDVPDVEDFYDLHIVVCDIGAVQLQVIEGAGNTIYGDFLRSHGQGVFHLGFVVDDIDNAEKQAEGDGLQVLSRGRRADGSGFTYFDTVSELGVALLLRQSPSDG